MIWEKIRGHGEWVEMFRNSACKGRLSHAYLFVGPEGIGKKLFARSLAQCLFCERFSDAELEACGECLPCRQMTAETHPDFLSVGCPEGKNVLPIELFAGSKEKRGREGLCFELSLRPLSGNRKIALIDDAELMNAESANALLKTLEEPPNYCTMILLASQTEGMLPTIRSRCQQIRFSPLSQQDTAELLLELDRVEDRAEAETIASLCEGSLHVANQLLDPQLRQLRDVLYESLPQENIHSAELSKTLLEGLDQIGGDAHAQRTNAKWLIRFAVEFYRRVLRKLSGDGELCSIEQVEPMAARCDPDCPEHLETIMEMIDRAAQAEEQLNRSTPVPLCLEGLFNDLGLLSRRSLSKK
jgi:DNA polymerase-3 subunit delta'